MSRPDPRCFIPAGIVIKIGSTEESILIYLIS